MIHPHTLTIALVDPQIPQNTGNIARLCAATGTQLDLVGKRGYSLDDKYLKRAGLDYWDEVKMAIYDDADLYFETLSKKYSKTGNFYLLTTKSTTPYWRIEFQPNDTLIFGSETSGLDAKYRNAYPAQCITIPMSNPNIRSLNLATSAGIVLYGALSSLAI